ncbi:MAG: hypothetical protein OEL77_07990 [Nitrosopumilus sp.]|nr:hypothetical protein [Nitrosopumilus sp.]MDH3385937.1 hypothetical protein [Nitrosopumilus sp.]
MVEIVSPDLKSKINFKILIAIFAGVVIFQLYLNILENEEQIELSIITVSLTSQIITGIAALIVARKYRGTRVFGRAYLSLAGAFFSVAIGEIIYNVYLFVFDLDPYPSIADIFFFLLYPFTLLHLLINIKFFKVGTSLKSISVITMLAFVIILVYSYVAYSVIEAFDIDFFYGLIFISGAAIITSVGIYGVVVVRKIPLGKAWILLVCGILLGTIGDVWYQYLEILGSYDTSHMVNLFWYSSYLVIIYSLYKHYKII